MRSEINDQLTLFAVRQATNSTQTFSAAIEELLLNDGSVWDELVGIELGDGVLKQNTTFLELPLYWSPKCVIGKKSNLITHWDYYKPSKRDHPITYCFFYYHFKKKTQIRVQEWHLSILFWVELNKKKRSEFLVNNL